jgi:hypothetical protein
MLHRFDKKTVQLSRPNHRAGSSQPGKEAPGMPLRSRSTPFLLGFGLGLLALLALPWLPGLAQEVGGNLETQRNRPPGGEGLLIDPQVEYQAAADSTGFGSPLVIPAADFSSDGFKPESYYFDYILGYVRGNSLAYGCLKSPAYLPDDAILTDLFATVYDNDPDPADNVDVRLYRVNNYTGVVDILANAGSSGASPQIQPLQASSIQFPQVTAPDYSYYVTTCVPSDQIRFYSIRLYYDRP